MTFTEEPGIVSWPETHYVFIEKIGPFINTAPQAWQELQQRVPEIAAKNTITGFVSLYKMGPNIYRAGVSVDAPPADLPQGLQYMSFSGGKYTRFRYTGPYSGLAEASGRAWSAIAAKKTPLRDDFAIEHYLNDPKETPPEQLITEILLPME
jgi:effector-binding domain-containing protein